ncbi:MAG: 4'-phosphopantetheinyl transferase superfamily protein [Pseudonocardiaceae bacterium]|nr:4'-phosphopantetheinyl transferase superfamily protein [Pseudonocardiaceae bacterium]
MYVGLPDRLDVDSDNCNGGSAMHPAPLVGIDVMEPTRIEKRLEARPGLRTELFTKVELAYCDSQHHPQQHLAARFCAKEAVVKALALDAFDPLDIEVLPGDPAPTVRLTGPAQDRADQLDVSVRVSLSHVASTAVAVALVVRRGFDLVESLSSSAHLVDDLVGGFVPDEGLGVVVPVLGPELDGLD